MLPEGTSVWWSLVELGEDFVDGAVDALHGDLALFTGFNEPPEKFLAVDGLTAAVVLDDAEFCALYLFVGGKARAAVEAFASSSNRRTILGTPGVDNLVLVGPALDTTHSLLTKLSADSAGDGAFGRKILRAAGEIVDWLSNFGIVSINLKKTDPSGSPTFC